MYHGHPRDTLLLQSFCLLLAAIAVVTDERNRSGQKEYVRVEAFEGGLYLLLSIYNGMSHGIVLL